MARGSPVGPVQVVRVQHSPDISGRANARAGCGRRAAAHRPDGRARCERRTDRRRIYAILRPVLRAVLQQLGLRRADPSNGPVLLRVPQERGQSAPADAVRVPQDEEPVHVHVARGPSRVRACLPKHQARVHAVFHG